MLTTLQEATSEGSIFPSIEKLRNSMNGPLTVVDTALSMRHQYIAGMDYEAEGAKQLLEAYTEICTQLDKEIPEYVKRYQKGISFVVLRLSTVQAQYYDDISKIFEMVFKEKGLKGDRVSYRRERLNREVPKLRIVSVYRAIAEDRLPESKEIKEMDFGSYGCGEDHTRKIWEATAGVYLSHLAHSATAKDRLKEYCEWRKNHRGENAATSSFSGRTNKSRLSIGNRSTPAFSEVRDGPVSAPPDPLLDARLNVGQHSLAFPIPASHPAHRNLHSCQGSKEQVVSIRPTLQRSATISSAVGLAHKAPARAPFTPAHHRSRSYGCHPAINKSLPAIPPLSEGFPTSIYPPVPPRPPGGHRRQRSEGQGLMEDLRSHTGQDDRPEMKGLGEQPNTRERHQRASAQPVTVVTSVAHPITKQPIFKSNLTQKLRNHQ